jgi:putative membrane protein (TIGR04086 family)
VTLQRDALLRGIGAGLAVIVPLSVLLAILDHYVDNFDDSAWNVALFILILAAYVLAGFCAGQRAQTAPMLNGAFAALIAFAAAVVLRVLARSVQGDHLGLGLRAVCANVCLAAAFGLLGGALSGREGRT